MTALRGTSPSTMAQLLNEIAKREIGAILPVVDALLDCFRKLLDVFLIQVGCGS
jgi:hypothetical protein